MLGQINGEPAGVPSKLNIAKSLYCMLVTQTCEPTTARLYGEEIPFPLNGEPADVPSKLNREILFV